MASERNPPKMPPFPYKIPPVKLFLLSVLALTYGLAVAFFPSVSRGLATYAYFNETYFGCIGASAALSLIALGFKPSMRLYTVLCLRCYLLIVLGYSIGGFLSAKLVLGIGLMTEIGVLVAFPLNLAIAVFATLVFAVAQAWPTVFGPSGLVSAPSYPGFDELAVLCFVMALSAATAAWIGRMASRQKELSEAIRIQEGNLDTLAELNLNLQGYARTVDEESTERERNRISREIHDISGYIFTNLIALMDAAGSMRRDDQAGLTDILVTARAQAQEGLRETRVALRKLRSEHTGLTDSTRAIFKIVSIFRKLAGIEIELNMGNMPHFLAQDLGLALYRTVQEALTNAVRHGKATLVRISFWVEGNDLLLTISDNGKGASEVVKGIGLTGMDERISALGGAVSIGPAPEGGFSLSIRVPLKTAPEGR
jgi:signal transduction histidine kinase